MKIDKKIEQMIAFGVSEIDIKEEDYNKLKQETKNLIKLNDIKYSQMKGEYFLCREIKMKKIFI